jgi:hypothetical protein
MVVLAAMPDTRRRPGVLQEAVDRKRRAAAVNASHTVEGR